MMTGAQIQCFILFGCIIFFRIFGFLDCTDVRTCQPGEDSNLPDVTHEMLQQKNYSNYFKAHGLKCQVVVLPDGTIGSIYMSSIRHNDNRLVNLSVLNEYLMSILDPIFQYIYPALYCDAIYGLLSTLVCRYQNPTPYRDFLIKGWLPCVFSLKMFLVPYSRCLKFCRWSTCWG